MLPAMLLTWCCALSAAPAANDYGSLYQPEFSLDEKPRPPAAEYQAKPGDILFFDDHKTSWQLAFYIARADRPMHAGIVVQAPDGSLASLEAGYNDTIWVEMVPLAERLAKFQGAIWVRQRVTPLTEEENARLTAFARSVDRRYFAVLRLVGQMTPFRARGPWTKYCGKPGGIKFSYFCSECVVEALVHAGVMDAATARPRATYPRDLFFDHSNNAYLNAHLKLAPEWTPPALWTPTNHDAVKQE